MTLLAVYLVYALGVTLGLAWAGHRGRGAARAAAGSPAAAPTRVLVVGGTGGTGRQLVAQALERGLTVTALVRDPAKLTLTHERLTIVKGDVLDEASVSNAMRGQDAVLCALGHKRFLGPTDILSQGTRNLLRAMQAHGARRLVCETSLGLGDSAGRLGLYYTLFVLPVILPFYFGDKTRQERIVAGSDRDWVLVRPGALTNGARRGKIRHGRGVGNFLWTVSVPRADVAAFMLDQLTSDTYLGMATGVA
jgi:uncharacterized protein YbjT (DUF2867 family)